MFIGFQLVFHWLSLNVFGSSKKSMGFDDFTMKIKERYIEIQWTSQNNCKNTMNWFNTNWKIQTFKNKIRKNDGQESGDLSLPGILAFNCLHVLLFFCWNNFIVFFICFLWPARRHLGPSWSHLEANLRPTWGHLSWFGPRWGYVGMISGRVGRAWGVGGVGVGGAWGVGAAGHIGAIWGNLGPYWGHLGTARRTSFWARSTRKRSNLSRKDQASALGTFFWLDSGCCRLLGSRTTQTQIP
jgi:hypothetical protein